MMSIVLMIPKHPKMKVKCRASDKVLTLKAYIFDAIGLFDCFYKLYVDGLELDNDRMMLKDYGIEDGSIIKLTHWNDPLLFGREMKKKFFKLDFY